MSAPLLAVEGLTKRFGGLTANEDVGFTVPPRRARPGTTARAGGR